MEKNKRKIKTISFSLEDELEKDLLEYAETKKNFGRYVKHLIMLDKVSGGKISKMEIIKSSNIDDNELEL